jgi:hypothetical protein
MKPHRITEVDAQPPTAPSHRRQATAPQRVSTARVLGLPRPTSVQATAQGIPTHVNDEPVTNVRESWVIEDRWWTEHPLRRRYWEVVTEPGRRTIVFHDLLTHRWFSH